MTPPLKNPGYAPVDHVCNKVSKNINIMTKIKRLSGNQILVNIYYCLVSHRTHMSVIYGFLLWGNNYERPLWQLILMQNKVLGIINAVPLRDSITPHYVNLGLLKFRDIVKLYT